MWNNTDKQFSVASVIKCKKLSISVYVLDTCLQHTLYFDFIEYISARWFSRNRHDISIRRIPKLLVLLPCLSSFSLDSFVLPKCLHLGPLNWRYISLCFFFKRCNFRYLFSTYFVLIFYLAYLNIQFCFVLCFYHECWHVQEKSLPNILFTTNQDNNR